MVTVFMVMGGCIFGKVLQLLLLNFLIGFKLELIYLSLTESIRSSHVYISMFIYPFIYPCFSRVSAAAIAYSSFSPSSDRLSLDRLLT